MRWGPPAAEGSRRYSLESARSSAKDNLSQGSAGVGAGGGEGKAPGVG